VKALKVIHRLLVADFRNIKENKPIIYQEKKIKVWKLKEKYTEILKKKVPRDEIKDVETEWERFKGSLMEAAVEVCGRKEGKKKHKKTPWWTDRQNKRSSDEEKQSMERMV
jgi:replication initiation and membrane attachment protein DnaB